MSFSNEATKLAAKFDTDYGWLRKKVAASPGVAIMVAAVAVVAALWLGHKI